MCRVRVNAKVNLALKVGAIRGDRHLLDTVVASCEEIYDVVSLNKRSDRQITVNGTKDESNTAVRMYRALMSKFDALGADILIEKGIPFNAGFGGSSADAAAVALAFQSMYGEIDENNLIRLCDGVGSDVFYMTIGGCARLMGYGEIVEPIALPNKLCAVVAKPFGGVSTAKAFALFDQLGGEKPFDIGELTNRLTCGDIENLRPYMKNQLFTAALHLNGNIGALVDLLETTCPTAVVMSGSGSGVLALYGDILHAREACDVVKKNCEFAVATYIY